MNSQIKNTLEGIKNFPTNIYGMLHISGEEAVNNVYNAIKCGFRAIDGAQSYYNEQELGMAIKKVIEDKIATRDDLFITTKLSSHRVNTYENTIKYINESLQKLQLDYIDLFLIHLPRVTPDDSWKDLNAQAWCAMEYMVKCGKIKHIGVSNFMIHHLTELFKTAKIKPCVNQIEYSAQWQQREVVDFCKKNGIFLQGFYVGGNNLRDNKKVIEIANRYNKTPMQILLKYCLRGGVVPITKSSNMQHIKSNLDIMDFDISDEEVAILDELNSHPVSAEWGLPDDKFNVWRRADWNRKEVYKVKIKLFKVTIVSIDISTNIYKIWFFKLIPLFLPKKFCNFKMYYRRARYSQESKYPNDFTLIPKDFL
ncbi:aldo/keto reductase family protein [Helicobacter sp. T3_23-1059]